MSVHARELQDAPPRDVPRIFVGNLNLNITDASLQSLLSRFGSIDNFSRSSCATFAHVSLKADEPSLTRCISSLNHVKWFGTSLRVERAKQHYLHRLLDEWQQTSVNTETESDGTHHHQAHDAPSKPPFHNMSKGTHVRFSLIDDERQQHPSSTSPENDVELRDRRHPSAPRPKNPSAFRSKEQALQTTLSLFGLSAGGSMPRSEKRTAADTSFQSTPKRARTPCSESNLDDKPAEASPSAHTAHRQITTSSTGKDHPDTEHQLYSIESAKAVEEDPTKIDLQRERNHSLSIYRSMFAEHTGPHSKAQLQNEGNPTGPISGTAASFRRAALYTKLQTAKRAELTSSPSKSARDKPMNARVQSQDVARGSYDRNSFTALGRRAALYKSLQTRGTYPTRPTNRKS